jgi:hypothetical protein
MARDIKDIKREMTDQFMASEYMRQRYGFGAGESFDTHFSTVSLESIFFAVAAFGFWALEQLFGYHKTECAELISELKPHSERWYANKAKAFMLGRELVEDEDYYDTTGMADEEIERARVVKYAVAVEKAGVVYIKVATDSGSERVPLPDEQLEGLKSYMKECKDAGVVLEYINAPAEHFRLTMTIYYNPMVMNNEGVSFSGGQPVHDTIRAFIKNLPFNGEYRNASLVDALQVIEGVVIPELKAAEASKDGVAWETIDAKAVPSSGYYKIYNDADLQLTFKPYETVSD